MTRPESFNQVCSSRCVGYLPLPVSMLIAAAFRYRLSYVISIQNNNYLPDRQRQRHELDRTTWPADQKQTRHQYYICNRSSNQLKSRLYQCFDNDANSFHCLVVQYMELNGDAMTCRRVVELEDERIQILTQVARIKVDLQS